MNNIKRIIVCGVILALLICASGCSSVVMMLKGETECIHCEGSGKCVVCDGDSSCQFCDNGKVICKDCWGTASCNACGGDGETHYDSSCIICRGKGSCRYCEDGYEKCSYCNGEASCFGCSGSGECVSCGGDGKYPKEEAGYVFYYSEAEHSACNGTGVIVCEDCADGKCIECEGEGNEDCGYCDGTGVCNICKGDLSSRYGGRCFSCNSKGVCKECSGSKKEECRYCHGTGDCNECMGEIEMDCSCNDGIYYRTNEAATYNYYDTDTEEYKYDSNSELKKEKPFSKTCIYCGGKGYRDCPRPDCTNGTCPKCLGDKAIYDTYLSSGYRDCTYCNKSGKCSGCKGAGRVKCTYCD